MTGRSNPRPVLLTACVGSLPGALGKMCLLHERVVQESRHFLGRPYLSNLTIVKIHNCPVYTRCCRESSGCCFDYPWFWSSFGIVLFTLLMVGLLSLYYWLKRKRHAAMQGRGGGLSSVTTGGPAPAIPLSTVWRTRGSAQHWLPPPASLPKPPPYSSCRDCTKPPPLPSPANPPPYRPSCSLACLQAQPGRAWSRSFGEAPPPYQDSAAPAAPPVPPSNPAQGDHTHPPSATHTTTV